jgi:Ca-activated chloride channel family protein
MRRTLPALIAIAALIAPALLVAQDATFRSTNQTVAVYTTVRGMDGRLVTGLPRDVFSIYDDGRRQELTLFANDRQPITVVMLLDRSGSMRANFRRVEEAAEAFVSAMQPGDRARIGSFSDFIQVDPRDFTSDRGELQRILRTELQPAGPTPLWNAVNVGITALLHEDGRRVVLVFTDGVDAPASNASVSLRDVTRRAAEEDVMVYAIGLRGGGGFAGGRGGRRRGGFGGGLILGGGRNGQDGPDAGLPRIAEATGGGYFELTSTANLSATFRQVADELHQQYALGFTPTRLDGKMHELEVRLSDPGLVARARKNYLAR